MRVGDFACLERGEPNAPLVLCLHGFPDVPDTFDSLLSAIANSGRRAVAPYLRGYAPSTLKGPFDVERIAEDVVRLATALSPDRPVCLVGHDWGAVATYQACATRPERFARAVTLAVPHPLAFLRNLRAHPHQLARSWYMAFFQLRWLPEREIARRDFAFVDRLYRSWSPGWTAPEEHLSKVKACLAASLPYPIDYYRAMFWPPRELSRRVAEARQPERKIRVPTLHLQGADDGCVGPEVARGQERYFDAELESRVLDGVGHFLHLERPDEVNRRILEWLALDTEGSEA